MLVLPDGNTTIIIQGRQRFKLGEALQEEPFLKATYQVIEEEENITEDEMKAITSS